MNQFKNAQVIMLPTDKESNITLGLNELLVYTLNKSAIQNLNNDFINQHLYIINDDKIQEDDWVTNGKVIFQRKSTVGLSENCKKIIATTDTSLKLISLSHLGENWLDVPSPQPSKKWIEHYISKYNKGVILSDVLVEYELIPFSKLAPNRERDSSLKINPDNTINIKPTIEIQHFIDEQTGEVIEITIESKKDSWNKEADLYSFIRLFVG